MNAVAGRRTRRARGERRGRSRVNTDYCMHSGPGISEECNLTEALDVRGAVLGRRGRGEHRHCVTVAVGREWAARRASRAGSDDRRNSSSPLGCDRGES